MLGQDDYASMREVLSRRFNRVFQGDEGFSLLPDVIFMDGGKGHVSTALDVIDATGFSIPVVGMVKDDKHRTRALVCRDQSCGEYREIPLKGKPMLFQYIGRMQEEVHRFAIEYHRKLRGKRASGSLLDEINGIGPARRAALLDHFKSIDEIRQADVEALVRAPRMDRRSAESVWTYFHRSASGKSKNSDGSGK